MCKFTKFTFALSLDESLQLPKGSAYTLHVTVLQLSDDGIKFEWTESFTRADLIARRFDVPLGISVLSDGEYTVHLTVLDAYPGLSSDEALLNRRSLRVRCCQRSLEELAEPKVERTGRDHDDALRADPLPATFAGIFPTNQFAVVENCGKQGHDCPTRLERGNIDNTPSFPGYNWWFDPRQAHSMHFYNLDRLYDEHYHGADHVGASVVEAYAKHALQLCASLLGHACSEVVDVGAGRCYFSEGMRRQGANVLSVEGTASGVAACAARAGAASVVRHDLRLPLDLGRRFALATCTEVAEHLEPPFAGTLVHSLTALAEVVWFSSECPRWMGGGNADHVHHSNEQPHEFWDRLFLFFGYSHLVLPDDVVDAVGGRGRRVYYRSELKGRLNSSNPTNASAPP